MIVSKLSIAHFLIPKTRRGKQKKFFPFQNIVLILLIKYKRRSTRSTGLFLCLMGEEKRREKEGRLPVHKSKYQIRKS